ncbi:MAG TPA: hypothetical protein VK666_15340 [Chryseolinea sp.]|nr:hypothetical protein [Chryseolinea sp.]
MVLKFITGFIVVLVCLIPGLGRSQPTPALRFGDGYVQAIDLEERVCHAIARENWSDAQWSNVFPIYTKGALDKHIDQPVAGHYSIEAQRIIFKPLFSFSAGESYHASLYYERLQKISRAYRSNIGEGNDARVELTFEIPRSHQAGTYVTAVYPSGDTLYENTLRMYIYFSVPMRTGDAYEHIQLRDDKGNLIDKPFLIVDQELWDNERQRFTLLFDPGRIKRGIKSNLDMGLPLQRNHRYDLTVDSLWLDVHGNALKSCFKKRFIVQAPERQRLTIDGWKVIEPLHGTKDPLIIRFDKPLDYALALKYIAVIDPMTDEVPGMSLLRRDDKLWIFIPRNPWPEGTYAIKISPLLEDPSGNNFNNPFDIDLTVSKRVTSTEPISISFTVSSNPN